MYLQYDNLIYLIGGLGFEWRRQMSEGKPKLALITFIVAPLRNAALLQVYCGEDGLVVKMVQH